MQRRRLCLIVRFTVQGGDDLRELGDLRTRAVRGVMVSGWFGVCTLGSGAWGRSFLGLG